MMKKFLMVAMCFAIAVLLYPFAFSQTPVPSQEQQVTEEQKAPATQPAAQETGQAAQPAQSAQPAQPAQPVVPDATPESPATRISTTGTTVEGKVFVQDTNTYVNSKVKFKLCSRDNFLADKIEYRIDGSDVKVYDSPFNLAEEGKRVISYYGIDKIGNREDAKSMRVIVDNTAPSILVTANMPVLSQGSKVYVSKDFMFRVDARDELSGVAKVEYSLNGTDYKAYRAPFNIPSEGTINLKIRATDNVANVQEQFVMKVYDEQGKEVDVKNVAMTLQTDNVAPVVEIKADRELVQRNGRNVAANDVKYTITATDEASGVQHVFVRLDEKGDFAPYAGQVQFNTNGEHLIEAKAVDKAGNMSSVSILSVFVDIIPPETTIQTVVE